MEISEMMILEIVDAYQVLEYKLKKEGKDINDMTQSAIAEMIYEYME